MQTEWLKPYSHRGCLWSYLMWSTMSIISKVKIPLPLIYYILPNTDVPWKYQSRANPDVFDPVLFLLSVHKQSSYLIWLRLITPLIWLDIKTCKCVLMLLTQEWAEQLFKCIHNEASTEEMPRIRKSILHRASTSHPEDNVS